MTDDWVSMNIMEHGETLLLWDISENFSGVRGAEWMITGYKLSMRILVCCVSFVAYI
jgi:hypothetical protein